MHKYILLILVLLTASRLTAQSADTLKLDLSATIRLAQEQSPSVQSARNTYLSAYWNYRYYRANYLPSVTLTSTPYLNKEINKITQSDGSALFLKQNQMGADLTLKVNQNIALTGGSLFLKSGLSALDELGSKTAAFSTQPIVIGYQQSLFSYNPLRWDRRIEPLRFREARKQYAEALELVSAHACNHFFSLATAQMRYELAQQNFASADTLYRMAQGRYQIGTITENEMLQLEINRLNEETSVMDAQMYLEETMQNIRSYLGLDQQTPLHLVIPESVPDFAVPMQQALEMALQNSPDPDMYQEMRLESERSLAYARGNARLRADLYLQLGLSQTGPSVPMAYHRLNNQEYASISLSLPILDWGRARGQVRVARSQLELTNTRAEQGMRDFRQNVQKLVLQFNMQARKVHIAALTSQRAQQRHLVARRLYVMGRNSVLDLNAATSEQNSARTGHLSALQTYWSLYYTLRSLTGYDFERNLPIDEQLPI